MSLSQLSGKHGINYAKLRQKRSPNDQKSFGLYEDNLQYIESLMRRKPDQSKHQRAKSTLQHNYRHGTPITDLEELEGEKLFDQFFKLNNSKSDSDFMKDSVQREPKTAESDFLKFVENAIEYHKQSEVRFFRPTLKKQSHLEQKLKEATISNRLLANELNRYKQRESELKNKMKLMQKEFSLQYTQVIQKCAWLEELLAKQKIDNENSLLAVKKTVEMLQGKCKCQKGLQLYEKILKDVKTQGRQYDLQPTHSSSELSSNTEEEDFNYNYMENNRRKSLSKTSEEHQEQLVQSFMHGKTKNPRDFPKDMFMRKRPLQDPYYIEEENTINST